MNTFLRRVALVAAAFVLGLTFNAAPRAYADGACVSECNSEWPCRNDGSGCFGKVTYHRVRHGACMAKCTVKDEASAALNKASQVASELKQKASQVIDKGIEMAKEGAKAIEKAAVEAGNAIVATSKRIIGAGKRAVGGFIAGVREGAERTGRALASAGRTVMSLPGKAKALVAEWADKTLARAKVVYKEKIAPIVEDVKEIAKGFIRDTIAKLRAEYPAFNEIYAVLTGEKSLADAISDNADTLVKKGKPYILKKASDAAMKLIDKPLKKAAAWVVSMVLKMLESPIATAAANALAGAVASLAASVTAGAGLALQPFLTPILTPITKMSATMIMDWVRKQVSERLGTEIVNRSSGLIQTHIVDPLLARAYDGIWAALQKRFPVLRGREPADPGPGAEVAQVTGEAGEEAAPTASTKGKRGKGGAGKGGKAKGKHKARDESSAQGESGEDRSQSAVAHGGGKAKGKARGTRTHGAHKGRAGASSKTRRGRADVHQLAKRGSARGTVQCARACLSDNPESGRLRLYCYRGCQRQSGVRISFAPLNQCRGKYTSCRKSRCGGLTNASCRPTQCRRPFMDCRFNALRTAKPSQFKFAGKGKRQ